MPQYLYHDLARWEGEGGSHIPVSVHLTHTQPGMPSSEKEARGQKRMDNTLRRKYEAPERRSGLAMAATAENSADHDRLTRTHVTGDSVMHDKWRILASVDLRADADVQVQNALNIAKAVRGNLTMLYVRNDRSDGSEPVEWPANAEAADRDLDVRRVVVAESVRTRVTVG